MDNKEIFNRFDVLYNNIMSDKAPGLDEREVSVFFNKAQLEVLKNHLNPKGNKYTEGYDFNAKRQQEFAGLTKTNTCYFPLERPVGNFNSSGWRYQESDLQENEILSIVNESIEVLYEDDATAYVMYAQAFLTHTVTSFDIDGDGDVDMDDLSDLINKISSGKITNSEALGKMCNALITDNIDGVIDWNKKYTIKDIVEEGEFRGTVLTVVPLSNIEYDTLMSRPYKYPPHSQAWRIYANGIPEFIVAPGSLPIRYKIRYVKMPQEVDLRYVDTLDKDYSKHCCELPDFLIDEVLQRAVELAKNAWEGTSQTTVELGGRSE